MQDKREVDAVAASPVHEKCLFSEVLGDNLVSAPFSLKLTVLELFPTNGGLICAGTVT